MKCPQKHIFVCINDRSDKSMKSCGQNGLEIRNQLVKKVHENDLGEKVRVNKSGCLNACELGPVLVVYPSGIWYKNVGLKHTEEIIEKSIKNDVPVDSLSINKEDWDKM